MNRPSIPHQIVGVVCLMVAVVVAAPMAAAHGDEGKLEVVSVTPSGTTAVITVRLTYGNDAEPVDAATVTVAGDDGAGVRLDPVPMKRTQAAGEYSTEVTFPSAGTWNLRVTSVTPAASLTLTQPITADPGVTASTDEVTTTVAGADSPTPSTDGAGESSGKPLISPNPVAANDDSGSGAVPWILVGVAVIVVVAGAAVLISRRRGTSMPGD